MTTDEEIRRGFEAKRVLDEPLLKEAFARVEAALVDAMRRVDANAITSQHELVLSLQLLSKVHGYIAEHVTTGKLAAIQKESMAQRVIRAVRN